MVYGDPDLRWEASLSKQQKSDYKKTAPRKSFKLPNYNHLYIQNLNETCFSENIMHFDLNLHFITQKNHF